MPITVFSPDLLVLQLHASDPRRKAHQSLFNGSLDLVRCQPVIFLGQSVSYSLEKAWHIAKPCTPDCKNHPMSAVIHHADVRGSMDGNATASIRGASASKNFVLSSMQT